MRGVGDKCINALEKAGRKEGREGKGANEGKRKERRTVFAVITDAFNLYLLIASAERERGGRRKI